MSFPNPSTDHKERGLARFISQFKNKPFLAAVLSSYLNRIQELEDAAWEVCNLRKIGVSPSDLQDRIGAIVGRDREGLSDADYWIAIAAQGVINRSTGRPEDVLKVASLSLPTGYTFSYEESYPAGIWIRINEQIGFDTSTLFRNLKSTKSGGVRLLLIFSEQDPADWFRFTEGTTEVLDDGHGFGDATDLSVGGLFIDAFSSSGG